MSAAKHICPTGFHTRTDGFLYCDDVRVAHVHHQLMTSDKLAPHASPAFLYSRRQIENNVQEFREALKALPVPARLNFAVKCNYNLHILKLLRSLGCGATLVSGTEMHVASLAGFEPKDMLLNGSGKVRWEVCAAVKQGVLLNVDSMFDLKQIIDVCREQGEGTTARVLLRLNLDIDPRVHKYLSTGAAGSKFGLDLETLSRVTSVLTSDSCPVRLEGLHCHLGSTVKDITVFRESVSHLLTLRQELKANGLPRVDLINVGGGLAIDYHHHREQTLPFREEEEETKADLCRLRDHLQSELGKTASACKADRCLDHHLYWEAVEVLSSYIQERIPRSKLDEQLQDLFQRLGIKDSVSKAFPHVWRPKERIPNPADLINSLCDVFVTSRDDDVTLLLEPGRAILGNAGVLMMTTLGFKTSFNSKFLVVDGAMTDVIRPSLYGAYHFIQSATPHPSPSSSSSSSSFFPSSSSSSIIPSTSLSEANPTTSNNCHDYGNHAFASTIFTTTTTAATTIKCSSGSQSISSYKCNIQAARCLEGLRRKDQAHTSNDDDDNEDDDGDGGGVSGDGNDDMDGGDGAGRTDGGEEEEAGYHVMDVVGPVCESGDFLGKNRLLPVPARGVCVVLHDAGAYCSSLASNYNLRMRAAEVMVDGAECHVIRRPDALEDLMAPFHVEDRLL